MEVRLPSRWNGFTPPLHPLQLLVVCVIIYFELIWYFVNVPHLPEVWQPVGYALMTSVVILHCVTYLAATIINPADDAVIYKKNKGTSAKLDRTLHAHAIENNHCYLCEIDVGAKAKHCSSCNKCISGFDHHCIWLNNCVGKKNYRIFLTCLASGLTAVLLILVVNLTQFIAYFTDKLNGHILLPYTRLLTQVLDSTPLTTASTGTTVQPSAQFYLFYQPVVDEGFLSLIFITAALAFIALVLLGHLLSFHIFLVCKNQSTYEYIVQKRDQEAMDATLHDNSSASSVKEAQDGGCCTQRKNRKCVAPYPEVVTTSDQEKTTLSLA